MSCFRHHDHDQAVVIRVCRISPYSQGKARAGRLPEGVGSARRSSVQETDWHRLAKHEFTHKIAALLDQEAQAERFEQIVIVAPAMIVGELRKHLSRPLRERIVAEFANDLTGHPVNEIEKLFWIESLHDAADGHFSHTGF